MTDTHSQHCRYCEELLTAGTRYILVRKVYNHFIGQHLLEDDVVTQLDALMEVMIEMQNRGER